MALLLQNNCHSAGMGYSLFHTFDFAYSLPSGQLAWQGKFSVLFDFVGRAFLHCEYGHITFIVDFQRGKQHSYNDSEVSTAHLFAFTVYIAAILDPSTRNHSFLDNGYLRC